MSTIDSKSRPLPPPLSPVLPDCSLCGESVDYDSDDFVCRRCGVTWPQRTAYYDNGSWEDCDRGQCGSTTGSSQRCVLTDGHEREHQDGGGESWPGNPYKVWAYTIGSSSHKSEVRDESSARYFARLMGGNAVWRMSDDKSRTWHAAIDD